MSDLKLADVEILLKRVFVDRLEKATAAALTAAYETRVASHANKGLSTAPDDLKRIRAEVMDAYYLFYGVINTTNPRPVSSQP